MYHPLHVDPHVGVLESLDLLPAAMTVREERECIAGDLLEDRIVVVTGERHRLEDMPVTVVTARARFESGGSAASQPLSIESRMSSLRSHLPLTVALALAVACHDGNTGPNAGIAVGESFAVTGARSVALEPGEQGGRYYAVLVNTGTTAGTSESYSLRGSGIVQPAALAARQPATSRTEEPIGTIEAPIPDRRFESRLRDRERTELTPRMAAARSTMAARALASATSAVAGASHSALPSTVKVGDMVTVNVNGVENCTNPIYHRARVAAIGTYSIVLADSLNPPGGFTDADYARYAARFDTLVYPLDVGTFGQPTDIDGNGKIGLIFTLEVNRLTPTGSPFFIGGFTFSRDLFPVNGSARAEACAGSNEGEYFYLLAPDPLGRVNGNRRTAGFVDTNTTAVIAHEFQHLINSSRRLYVNNAPHFEEKWLDEGLAHMAEELLFYHEAGLAPRSNLSIADIQSSARRNDAFNLDMTGGGNTTRYRSYLSNPSRSSPYAADDSLTTRGAAWSLLRYLADRAAPTDGNIFFRLANGPAVGMANLQAVFGKDVPTKLRDWATSHAVDDVAPAATALQQPSWNWHSIYASLYGGYPLQLPPLVDASTYSGSIVAGGAAYYQFSVPAGGRATLTLGGTSRGSNLQFVVVRVE
jgi:hypothetical protein